MTTRSRYAIAGAGGIALAVTLAIQTCATFLFTAISALAPAIARDLDVPARWIGPFVSIVYAGMVAANLVAGGVIARLGAIRASQVCLALCALGVAAVAASGERTVALAGLGAIVIGLGYGPVTPASSHVLAHTAPPARRNLVFSVKQTGVPAGAALAGALLPPIAVLYGWRAALALVAFAGILVATLAQPCRARFDADRRPGTRIALAQALADVRHVLRDRRLTSLALVGLAFSSTQVSLISFLVVHLTQTLGWSLVSAGLALSMSTLAGVVGRVAWGALADRTGRADRVLTGIGAIAAICGFLLWMAPASTPDGVILAIVTVFGGTAIGWNGVQLAELARHAPRGEAGAITGASGVISFTGVIAAPLVFGALSATSGGTRSGFAALAVISATAAIAIPVSRRWVNGQSASMKSH